MVHFSSWIVPWTLLIFATTCMCQNGHRDTQVCRTTGSSGRLVQRGQLCHRHKENDIRLGGLCSVSVSVCMCLCQPDTHLVVTKQRRPTGSIKCLFSPIIGCLKRGRVPTLMNKWREKWEGSKLEGKTEESIELWLHTPSLSQTLSNPISRSRLLPSLRLCCYGDVCSRS